MEFIDKAGEAMSAWYVWVPMVVILLGLVGLMIFLRMKKKDDDE